MARKGRVDYADISALYFAMSLRALRGRTLITLRAGLALFAMVQLLKRLEDQETAVHNGGILQGQASRSKKAPAFAASAHLPQTEGVFQKALAVGQLQSKV